MMIEDVVKDAKARMTKSIEALKNDFGKIRSGRAHPSLIENVMVDSYGSMMPLKQVANISILDARMLQVTPWDKSAVGAIEKAIIGSGLGLNPASAGAVIRVPLPALTEERRKDLIKVLKEHAENGRVSVRNIRRDANQMLKDLHKEKDITEDDQRRGEEKIQKLTDEVMKEVEALVAAKEKELMAV
jgi:ribosome recycling factor